MLELITGLHRLPREALCRPGAGLAAGNGESGVLFITCSDLGFDPGALFADEDGPGRENLYVLQNAGHIVQGGPDSDGSEDDVTAALSLYEISDIIVCGHLPCGVTRSLLTWGSDSPRLANFGLEQAARASKIVQEHYRHLKGERLAEAIAGENVLVQLEHLLEIPAVAELLNQGRLGVHGWLFHGGALYAYDVLEEQFVPLNLAPAAAR